MFEAKFNQSGQIKKLIEAIKDVVSDANLECNENGISLQAMDPSHVSLVSLIIPSEDFEIYRCDEPITSGLNLNSSLKQEGTRDLKGLKRRPSYSWINVQLIHLRTP